MQMDNSAKLTLQSKKPKQAPGYRLESMDQDLLLFSPIDTQILYLNQTASLIWQLCDGERTVTELVGMLAESYPDAADSVQQDVLEAIEMFVRHKAVELA
jgi:hypothetical protein